MHNCMVSRELKSRGPSGRAAILLVLAAGGLFGCNRDDQVADTIKEATIQLVAVSPGASGTATPAMDAKIYNEVIASLKAVAGKGGDGQQAAVDLLTARAQFGLAGQTAVETGELERSALLAIAGVRDAQQGFLSYSIQADALSQFDPAPLLADIDKQITEREADLGKARKAKQDIDAQIAALQAQAQAKMDQAAAEHKIEAELREQAIRVSSTQAADLIVEASKHRRIADGFDVEASILEAQAAQIAPRSPEAQLVIDQMTNQRDQLGRGRREVEKHAADNRQLVTAARAEQAKAAEAVDAAVKAVVAARDADLPKKYEDAARQYADCASSAGKAAKANKTQSGLLVGEARQALGDLHWARAQGLGAAAAMFESLAATNPALPQQAEYARQAEATRASEKQALDAATEAFQAAKSAYEGANVKGDAAAKIEEVGKRLSDLILKTSDGSVDLRSDAEKLGGTSDAEGSGGAAPEPAPAPPVVSADSPQATLTALLAATKAGRFQDIANYVYIPDGPDRDLFQQAMGMMAKIQRLDSACKSKFGKSLTEDQNSVAAQASRGTIGAKLANGEDVDAASLTYTVTGDTATATHPDMPEPARFIRKNGKWLLDGSSPSGTSDSERQAAAMMIPLISSALDSVIADVQSGKLKSIEEVNMAILSKMAPGGG